MYRGLEFRLLNPGKPLKIILDRLCLRAVFSFPGFEPKTAAMPRPSSTNRHTIGQLLLIFLGGGLGLGILLAGATALVIVQKVPSQPRSVSRPHIAGNEQVDREQLAQVFGQEPLPAHEPLHRQLQSVLDQLGQDYLNKNAGAVAAHFDFDCRVDAIWEAAKLPRLRAFDRRNTVQRFRQRFIETCNRGALGWTRTFLMKVEALPASKTAIVYARHFNNRNGSNTRYCWWFVQSPQGWRIFDEEELECGFRSSTLAGLRVAADRGAFPPPWVDAVETLYEANDAIQARDMKKAGVKLAAIEHVQFPPVYEAYRWINKGLLEDNTQRTTAALSYYDQAEQLRPGLPVLDILRGLAYNKLGQWEKAVKHLEAYVRVLGDDNEVCYELGRALLNLGRFREAEGLLRKSLDYDPEGIYVLELLRQLLPDAAKGELAGYFRKLQQPEQHFEALSNYAFSAADAEALTVLANTMLELRPGYAEANYALAHAQCLQRNYPPAQKLYQQAIQKQNRKERRQVYVHQLLLDMLDAGQMLQGYQLAPDKEVAFRDLAAELLANLRLAELRQLLETHQKAVPTDSLLPYYWGQVALNERKFAEAESWFARFRPKRQDNAFRQRCLADRVYVWYRTGKGLEAYDRLTPRKEVFRELVRLFTQANEPTNLKELLARHRKHEPLDTLLIFQQAELHWHDKQYEAAAAVLQQHRALLDTDEHLRYQAKTRLLLCLLLADHKKELRQEVARLAMNLNDNQPELQTVFRTLRSEKRSQEALAYAALLCELIPQEPAFLLDQARAHIVAEHYALATAFYHQVQQLPHLQDWQRTSFQQTFLYDMIAADREENREPVHALEGYHVVADKKAAFRQIAGDWTFKKRKLGWRDLLERHRNFEPGDIWLRFYEAEQLLREGKAAAAEQTLIELLPDMTSRFDRDTVQRRWIDACLQQNKIAAAYEKLGARRTSFHLIAAQCTKPEQHHQLTELLRIHRQHFPNDDKLLFWDVEARWLAKDHEGVVQMLEEHKDTAVRDRFNGWKYRDHWIRSLLHLQRLDQARQVLHWWEQRRGLDRLLTTLVQARAGDVQVVAETIADSQRGYGSLYRFYSDPDLGPLLRSAPFAPLRERFPEPVQVPLLDDADLDDF